MVSKRYIDDFNTNMSMTVVNGIHMKLSTDINK